MRHIAGRSVERLTLIALLLVSGPVESAWAAQQQKQVLVLYATRRDAMGERPLTFVVNRREALFGDTPMVSFADRDLPPPGNATGVIAPLNLTGTLALAILTAVLLLVAQSGLIAGLLIQSRRRQQAEAEVLKNQADLRRSFDRIRDLGTRLLNAQDSERSRIARELHDDISQQAALLEIGLAQLHQVVHGEAEALTRDALFRAQGVARSVHDLSHRLHPAKLRLIGLVGALHGLRRELSQPDIAITVTDDNVPPALPEQLALCLFRIVQEALQNAIKHSRGHHVAVQLRGDLDQLTVSIADDGVGFDVDRTWRKGLGLISMQERLEAIGGSLKVLSKPGAGTRLEVRVPLRTVPDLGAIHPGALDEPISR